MRIARFRGLGQKPFGNEQLAAPGKIGIAVIQFDNNYSQMNAGNKKGFKLMTRVEPGLIIPAHNSSAAART